MNIKNILLTIFTLFTIVSCYSQPSKIVTDIEGDNIKGVVFNKDYKFSINVKNEYFTPTIKQILHAESLLKESLKNEPNSTKTLKAFKKSKRQYVGYIENDNHYIQISLLNISLSNQFGAFKDWENEIIYGSGEFYEKNFRFYTIEISN